MLRSAAMKEGQWRIAAMILLALLAIGVVWSLVRTPSGEPEREVLRGPAPPCPFGYMDRVGQGELIMARLRTSEEGRQIADALGTTEVRFCFGDIEVPAVTEGRLLLLTEGESVDVLAARTGHLLTHVLRGPPLPDDIPRGADCDALVRRALRAEARAYAIELRLRRDFGVMEQRYEFEAPFHRARDGERVIYDYFRAHPEGGPGLDPLPTAYRQRCDVESR
jgi:hypothetical protein